jgi:hypothetical protein
MRAEYDRTAEHSLHEREHLADGGVAYPVAAELVGELGDHCGRDAPQLVLAKPRQHVLVPSSGVVDQRVAGEVRASVGAEPLARPFVERLVTGLELAEVAELLAAADVGLEPHRVFMTVEGADVFAGAAACLAPANAVGTAPVLELALLDHSWITSFPSERGHGRSLPARSEISYSASSSSSSPRPGPFRPSGRAGAGGSSGALRVVTRLESIQASRSAS